MTWVFRDHEMTNVIQLDSATSAKLRAANGPAELVDESGQPIGRYSPLTPAEPLCPWDPDFTVEDAERIYAENDGMTFEQFLKEWNAQTCIK